MLTIDSAAVEFDREQKRLEEHREKTDWWVKNQLAHACYVSENGLSVANEERQMGKGMLASVFKEVIQKLNHKLKVEHHPFSDDLCVYYIKRAEPWEFDPKTNTFGGEQKVFVTAVRDTVVPEWSIMSTRLMKEYDPDRTIAPGQLGYRWVKVPHRELTRGWRAVLAKLLNSEIVTLDQVNRIADKYGSEARESWAAKTGQLSGVATPF